MLVLSGQVGESIVVGPGVRVKLVKAANGKARLAIDAPPGVRIQRGELAALNREATRYEDTRLPPDPEPSDSAPERAG